LGKSLEDHLNEGRNKFTLKTVLMLCDQMISCVEFMHNKNYIHRDIKPDNFVMGRGSTANKVFMIDFGLSKRYRDQFSHQHIPWIDGKSLTGTARYASVNALKGNEQSRRDDMEALGYVWIYLLKGSLPWMGLKGNDQKHKYAKICEVKAKTKIEDLCKGFPNEFVQYFKEIKKLHFTDTPNYSYYRQMFRDLFIRLGYVYDEVYDWTPQKLNTTKSDPPKLNLDLSKTKEDAPLQKDGKLTLKVQNDITPRRTKKQDQDQRIEKVRTPIKEAPTQKGLYGPPRVTKYSVFPRWMDEQGTIITRLRT
jgi:casein kinase 1